MPGKGIIVICMGCGLRKIYKTIFKKPCTDGGKHIWVRPGVMKRGEKS